MKTPQKVSIVEDDTPLNPTLESMEKAYIHYIMSQTGGKKREAAKILGIDPSTLYRKIDKYSLKDSTTDSESNK